MLHGCVLQGYVLQGGVLHERVLGVPQQAAGATPELSARLPGEILAQQAHGLLVAATAQGAEGGEPADGIAAEERVLVDELLPAPQREADDEAGEEANREA